ncbi:AMP-dependent synthetase [Loktanella sp. 5RATIMAR09]|uniref:AMP-binding protein n=1 Tax=Loktanella sp. 5RATIMAR09 TaxID=1225655 RepID=UPI0006EBBDD2|nr:AMP-binding protein [Loktanella sp. 5RATIMAR09]KQI71824.1 AMP-dependent synthetase [Loktanella sp. 5RATIMAR09]
MNATANPPPTGTVRSWLDRRADEQGADISHYFLDADPLTWGDLRKEAEWIASKLAGMGLSKGDSVAVMLPNSRQGILCLFGVLYGGFRAAIINLVAGAEAMGYALSHSDSVVVLVGENQVDLLTAATAAHDVHARTVVVGQSIAWPDNTPHGPLADLVAADHALLMYTSGTTGRPKGVLHTHASLLAGGWTTVLAHDLSPHDRGLCVLPIYHINGLCVTIMGPLIAGGAVVVCEKFSASRFWTVCAEQQVTWFSVVPTIISHLLHGKTDPDAATKARIRFGRSASSALAVETQSAFEQRFGIPIVETMGLTETAAQILSNPLPPGLRKIGSPGLAYGNEVAILSPELEPLGADTEGEIAIRGPNVMLEYYKNPEATRATFTNTGWLRTGDLGKIDTDGYVFVTGRLKELIIKGGENIAPREVDETLYSHPDVVEAAAFARPCARYGERVEAAVKLRDGSTVAQPELLALCLQKLGKFKCPDVIHILDDLPKGPSGKIQRLRLAEMTA